MVSKSKEPKQWDVYKLLVNHSAEGIIFQESSGIIKLWNRYTEKVFGIKSKEVIGKKAKSLRWEIYKEDGGLCPVNEHPSTITLKTGKSCRDVVMKIVRPNSSFSWINVNTTPIFERDSKKPSAVVITFNDISSRIEAENQLRIQYHQAQKLAEVSAKLMDCEKEEDAYNLTGKFVYEENKQNIVLVCDFDYENKCLFISNIFGLSHNLDLIASALSINPMSVKLYIRDIAPVDLEEFKSKKLYQIKKGLYTIAGRKIKKVLCNTVEKMLGIKKVHVMGFTWDERLFGGIVILQRENEIKNVLFIESLINQTSLVLSRKQKEKKLTESEEKYRMLVCKQSEGIGIVDENEVFIFVNPAACRIFGYSEEEMLGAGLDKFVDEETFNKIKEETQKRKRGEEGRYRFEIIRKDGSIRWLEISTAPNIYNTGKYSGTFGVFRDVTEQKNLELALARSERMFRLIAEHSGDNITVTDLDLNITYISPNISKMRGYTAEEAMCHTMEDIFSSESLPLVYTTFQEQMQLEQSGNADPYRSVTLELEEKHKNGTMVWAESNFSFMRDADMKAIGIISVSRDITEKKAIQEALLQSEEKYRLLTEFTSDVIWVLNLSRNRFTFISPSVYHLRGLTVEEAMSETIESALTEDSLIVFNRMLHGYVDFFLNHPDEEKTYIHQVQQPCKDGSVVWVEVSVKFRFNKSGEIEVVGVSRNINERKQAEFLLNESEKKYRELFEYNRAGILIFLLKEGFPVVAVNEAACKISGYSKEEILHKNPLLFEKGINEELISERLSLIKQSGIYSVDTIIYHQNGTEINVRIDSQLINYNGKPAIQSVLFDIGEIIKAEAEAKRLEMDYMEIFNSTHDAIIIHDAQTGKIIDANKTSNFLFGYNKKEDLIMQSIGKLCSDIIPYTEEFAIRLIKKAMNGYSQKFEWYAKKCNGTLFWVEVALSSTSIGGENRVLAVVRDISERKEAENRIITAKNDALEKNLLKSAFLANMSHDMRTPLNAILGFSKLIAEEQTDEKNKKQYMSIIDSSGKQLLAIINDLIDITKIESNQLQIKKEKICINEIILELYIQTKNVITNKKVELKYHLDLEDDLSYIITDNIRLRQILNNLLNNATKFTENGVISFGYTKKGNEIEFYIEDTGSGIPPESLSLIFERYKQLDNPMEVKTRGFGLGLAISRSLIELLGGKIRVESEMGKGSRFIFTVPYLNDEMVEENIREEEPDISAFAGLAFLVVDDEWVNYMYLRELLVAKGIKVIYANNGLEAVRQAQNNPDIKLVLMDIRMPVMNGFEAAAEIRKIYQDMPIIFQTAYALTDEKQIIIDKGCNQVLYKPIKPVDLYRLVFETLIDSKK
jgi:hypothetical protein